MSWPSRCSGGTGKSGRCCACVMNPFRLVGRMKSDNDRPTARRRDGQGSPIHGEFPHARPGAGEQPPRVDQTARTPRRWDGGGRARKLSICPAECREHSVPSLLVQFPGREHPPRRTREGQMAGGLASARSGPVIGPSGTSSPPGARGEALEIGGSDRAGNGARRRLAAGFFRRGRPILRVVTILGRTRDEGCGWPSQWW